jgi:hypothetical protein
VHENDSDYGDHGNKPQSEQAYFSTLRSFLYHGALYLCTMEYCIHVLILYHTYYVPWSIVPYIWIGAMYHTFGMYHTLCTIHIMYHGALYSCTHFVPYILNNCAVRTCSLHASSSLYNISKSAAVRGCMRRSISVCRCLSAAAWALASCSQNHEMSG